MPSGAQPRPLHIAHVVRSDGFAGVERYIANVSAGLHDRGHAVTVIGGDVDRMAEAISRPAIRVLAARSLGQVAIRLARLDADLVHLHMTAAEVAAVLTWPVRRTPALATRHFAKPRGSSAAGAIMRPLIRRRLAVQIAVSDAVARAIDGPSMVVRSAVPSAPPVDALARVVLVAQRLEPEKRTFDAIAAFDRSGLAAQGWECWVCGDGAQRTDLESRTRQQGIGGVRFLGHRSDLHGLRAEVGMQLAPTPDEAFGFSVAEAMAAGLPVVAVASGGHLETVGAAVPECTYAQGDLAAAGALLRRLALDEGERAAIGQRVRSFQQQHLSLDAHVDALLHVYHRVVSRELGGSRS